MKAPGIWRPTPAFIAYQADPTSKHWKEHTNKCVLPAQRDVKPLPVKPDPRTTLHPPVKQTPQASSGTLIRDDGERPLLRRSHRQAKGKRK